MPFLIGCILIITLVSGSTPSIVEDLILTPSPLCSGIHGERSAVVLFKASVKMRFVLMALANLDEILLSSSRLSYNGFSLVKMNGILLNWWLPT